MRIWSTKTLVLIFALACVGCKKDQATEEPDPNAPPDPEDYAPDEEESPPPDPYAGMSEEEKMEKAKGLYMEAEELAKASDWEAAEVKYEEAYYLVPGKHGFAFKVGKAAFEAGHCQKAEEYLRHFETYADPQKQKDRLKEARDILAKTNGCAGG